MLHPRHPRPRSWRPASRAVSALLVVGATAWGVQLGLAAPSSSPVDTPPAAAAPPAAPPAAAPPAAQDAADPPAPVQVVPAAGRGGGGRRGR